MSLYFSIPLILSMIFLQLAILDELERIEIALAKNREKQVITLGNVCSPYTVRLSLHLSLMAYQSSVYSVCLFSATMSISTPHWIGGLSSNSYPKH